MGSFTFFNNTTKISQKKVLKRPIEKSYAWHAHDYREVLATLNVRETGLDIKEVHARQIKYGPNQFTEKKQKSIYRVLMDQLSSPLTVVLLLACGFTVFLNEYVDAFVIFIALAIAVLVGVLQEGKASKAFRKLADSQIRIATVLREGKLHQIEARELVPGDIVIIEAGMYVPADIRLTKTKLLSINESPFGEQFDMAWMGTFVAEGHGEGVVVKIGDKTVVGALAKNLRDVEEEETPLQLEMKKISKVMLWIIAIIVSSVFLIGIYRGFEVSDMMLMSVAIAVASVPEGLPAAVTIVLAVGMEVLLKRGGLVKNLLAAETLGSTTYVLTDKTGTLTMATMEIGGVIYDHTTNMAPKTWKRDSIVGEILDLALCASNSFEDREDDSNKTALRGDPVEKAILTCAHEIGFNYKNDSKRAERVDYLSFTSENRFAAGLTPHNDKYRLCINGSPEYILEQAYKVHGEYGVHDLTEVDRNNILAEMRAETKLGKRLVAVGYKDVSYDNIPEYKDMGSLVSGMVFMGILIFSDPVRQGVKEAIKGVREAGAQVILITGDNEETALSIAQKVGIAGSHEVAFTGKELEELSDEELIDVLDNVHVFARVLPNQKMRIAQVLQMSGEIVAMTGDGINDAAALRKAHIGVALGSGTEVAKEASDLILVNDTFATIYAAIEEGRRIISNLRKITGYLLSTSLSEVALFGTALLLGNAVPILPVQILWANIIEEGLMSVAFAFEKGDKDTMKRLPSDIHEEGILSRSMIFFLGLVIVVLSSLLVLLYLYIQSMELDIEILRSAMFLAISIDSMFIAFAFRSLTTPLWKISLRDNIFFIGAFVLSSLLLFVAITVPFMQNILSYVPLSQSLVLTVIGFSVLGLVVVELAKMLFFEGKN